MGQIRGTEPVKLFTGLIAASRDILDKAAGELVKTWGIVDGKTEAIEFTFTDYYAPEMGKDLVRQWVSFEKLIDPSYLADIKRATNAIEENFTVSGKRCVNIDPGYIALSKIVLASTKDFSHRIYLSGGIFAELTLLYKGRSFTALPWTYPDYQSNAALDFFGETRRRYHVQLQEDMEVKK